MPEKKQGFAVVIVTPTRTAHAPTGMWSYGMTQQVYTADAWHRLLDDELIITRNGVDIAAWRPGTWDAVEGLTAAEVEARLTDAATPKGRPA